MSEDIGTYSITFRTSKDGYAYILSYIESHTELVSDRILPDIQVEEYL